jgi:hypothetical protein
MAREIFDEKATPENRAAGARANSNRRRLTTFFSRIYRISLDSLGFLPGARIHRLNQIAERKQRDAQDGAQQIEIMANAIFGSPAYSREDTKRFEYVSKNNDHKRRCAKQLESRGRTLFS